MSSFYDSYDEFDMQDVREQEDLARNVQELSAPNWDDFLYQDEDDEEDY